MTTQDDFFLGCITAVFVIVILVSTFATGYSFGKQSVYNQIETAGLKLTNSVYIVQLKK